MAVSDAANGGGVAVAAFVHGDSDVDVGDEDVWAPVREGGEAQAMKMALPGMETKT